MVSRIIVYAFWNSGVVWCPEGVHFDVELLFKISLTINSLRLSPYPSCRIFDRHSQRRVITPDTPTHTFQYHIHSVDLSLQPSVFLGKSRILRCQRNNLFHRYNYLPTTPTHAVSKIYSSYFTLFTLDFVADPLLAVTNQDPTDRQVEPTGLPVDDSHLGGVGRVFVGSGCVAQRVD